MIFRYINLKIWVYINMLYVYTEDILRKRRENMPINKCKNGYEGNDRYDRKFSIQLSSLAGEDCIWFGLTLARMHLTREQVKEIIPVLQEFVDTGEI